MLTGFEFADQAYLASVAFLGCVNDAGGEGVVVVFVCCSER